jgi:hypothetical protein
MQDRSHRQDPMLFLVPVEGEGKSVDELSEECRADLHDVAEKHLAALSGSRSHWLPFLRVIAAEAASVDETVPLTRVV